MGQLMKGLPSGVHVSIAALGALLALSGCASMGGEGNTRAATAKALGLKPGDVIIVSRSYQETGPGVADIALANYTVETSGGLTYICDPHAVSKAAAPDEPVCKRKPK